MRTNYGLSSRSVLSAPGQYGDTETSHSIALTTIFASLFQPALIYPMAILSLKSGHDCGKINQ
jgi:hypothetical protein